MPDQAMEKQFGEVPIFENVFRKLRLTVSVALLALASNAAGIRVNRLSQQTQAKEPELPALAVLPLENLSGDSSQDHFVDAMTDELMTDLAKEKSLRVISRTSVMRYKGSRKTLPEIARELNVDVVIEGSVERVGKRVRIRAQLLYAHTDRHVWAETYKSETSDVLHLQSEVGHAIAGQCWLSSFHPCSNHLAVTIHTLGDQAIVRQQRPAKIRMLTRTARRMGSRLARPPTLPFGR
jgi:TolB-like protein